MYDPTDQRGVPASTGIPSIIVWTGIVGVVFVFVIAGLVLATSQHGHLWPAADTLRLKL